MRTYKLSGQGLRSKVEVNASGDIKAPGLFLLPVEMISSSEKCNIQTLF